jgi:hypothetical protein
MHSAAGVKRTYAAVSDDEGEDVIIISLGQGIKFLSANSYVLRCYSMCARHLPPESTVWDLSSLVVEGRPPTYDVVASWLDVVHMVHEGDLTPEWGEGKANLDTLDGVCQLLAFADAVGSSRGVIKACLRVCKLQSLVMPYEVENGSLSLIMDGRCYACSAAGGCVITHHITNSPNGTSAVYYPTTSPFSITAEQRAQLVITLGDQLERAAYLGYKLQLQPLQYLVTSVISSTTLFKDALLYGQLHRVFTARVREAAGLADDEAFRARLHSITDVPLLPTKAAPGSGLLLGSELDANMLTCGSTLQLKLQRSLLGAPSGKPVWVKLSLSEGSVSIGELSLPVEVVLRPK